MLTTCMSRASTLSVEQFHVLKQLKTFVHIVGDFDWILRKSDNFDFQANDSDDDDGAAGGNLNPKPGLESW